LNTLSSSLPRWNHSHHTVKTSCPISALPKILLWVVSISRNSNYHTAYGVYPFFWGSGKLYKDSKHVGKQNQISKLERLF
jgi:hypothetical protein